MVVIQCIENLPARFPCADEVHLTQSAQLMGDGGFGHAESVGKGAYTHFPVHELGNDANAARVAEGTEEFS